MRGLKRILAGRPTKESMHVNMRENMTLSHHSWSRGENVERTLWLEPLFSQSRLQAEIAFIMQLPFTCTFSDTDFPILCDGMINSFQEYEIPRKTQSTFRRERTSHRFHCFLNLLHHRVSNVLCCLSCRGCSGGRE